MFLWPPGVHDLLTTIEQRVLFKMVIATASFSPRALFMYELPHQAALALILLEHADDVTTLAPKGMR